MKTRLAPTPNGSLHIGNLISFVNTYMIARAHGAKIFLRIDDLYTDRARDEFIEEVFRSLEWLGIEEWEGPQGLESFKKEYSQKHREDLYRSARDEIKNYFNCACSRKEILERTDAGIYDGHCRGLGLKDSSEHRRRLDLSQINPQVKFYDRWQHCKKEMNLQKLHPDPLFWRNKDLPSYHLASLVDDEHFGLDLVVRGDDLLESTAIQLLLGQQLSKNRFDKAHFYHHPTWRNEQGEKLSKSQKNYRLEDWSSKKSSFFELYLGYLGLQESRAESLEELAIVAKPFFEQLGAEVAP